MRTAAGRPMRALQPALLAHAPWGALAPLLGGAFASNVRTATTQSG
jgi:hypothetical protein